MVTRIFTSLSQSYLSAIQNAFYFVGRSPLVLMPVALIFALFYAIILVPASIVFGVLVFLDWISALTDMVRKSVLDGMEQQSWSVDNSLGAFLFRPILLLILCPLFILSVLIPKLSSNALTHTGISEVSYFTSGAGSFGQINATMWRAARRLFVYVVNVPLLLQPFAAVVAAAYSLVLICVGFMFFILIPLDVVSRFIEGIRQGVARFANNQQQKIRYSVGAFLFVPLLLVVLAPIFLATILVPKFSTHVDVSA